MGDADHFTRHAARGKNSDYSRGKLYAHYPALKQAMKLRWFRFLSAVNRLLLPKIYRKKDLTQLSNFDKAVVGWKLWVTYRFLDAQTAQAVKTADKKAIRKLGI